ncbi:MAG: serine hydrolase [Alphaproteobacteria bacterium]
MSRRAVLFAVAVALSPPALADDWPRGSLRDAGLPADAAEQIDTRVASGRLENLHALIVVRHGRMVLERYYEGRDFQYGRDLGVVRFGPETLHDVRSISKSVTGLLYGIALAEGKVPAPDAPLLDGFAEYADLAADPERQHLKVEHALTMTLGLAWDERLPYTDPKNDEVAMERSPDRYRYVLSRPIVGPPGARWAYSGGATTLLGRLIERGTGRSLLAYAHDRLFGPLDIRDVEWMTGGDGSPAAASGLRLRPRDLARIGQLVLQNGRWEGEQIVPTEWLAKSFEPRAQVNERMRYGYQWWLGRGWRGGLNVIAAFGNGGQRLFVVPKRDLVVVATAGNYNRHDLKHPGDVVMDALIMPALLDE